MKGRVIWFNQDKGFGFIKPDDGDDLYVHISQLDGKIEDGETVEFEIGEGPKGPMAINVKLLSKGEGQDQGKGRGNNHSLSGWKGDAVGDSRKIVEKLDLPLTAPFSSLSDISTVESLNNHLESSGSILITWFRDSLAADPSEEKYESLKGKMAKMSANFIVQVAEKFPNSQIRMFDWPDIFRSYGETKRSTHPYISFICRAAVIVAPTGFQIKDEEPFKMALTEAVHSDILNRSREKWIIVGDETGDLSEFRGKGKLSPMAKSGRRTTMCWLAIPPNTNLSSLPLDFHCSGKVCQPYEKIAIENILEHEQVLCFTFPFEQGHVVKEASRIGQDSHLSLWQHTLPLVLEYISSLTTQKVDVDIFIEQVDVLESGSGIIHPIATEFLDALGSRKGWKNISFDQLWVLSKSPLEHPWLGYPDALGSSVHDKDFRTKAAVKRVEKLRQRTISTPYRQESLNGTIRQALKDTARPLVFLKRLSSISPADIRDYIEPFFQGAIAEALESLTPSEWQDLLFDMIEDSKDKKGQNASVLILRDLDLDATLEKLTNPADKFDLLMAVLGSSNHVGSTDLANRCKVLIELMREEGYKPPRRRLVDLKNLSGGANDNQFDFSHISDDWEIPDDAFEIYEEEANYLGAQALSRALRGADGDLELAWKIEELLLERTTNHKDLRRRYILRSELLMEQNRFESAIQALEIELPEALGVANNETLLNNNETLLDDAYYLASLLKAFALSGADTELFTRYSVYVKSSLNDDHPSQRIAYWFSRWASEIAQSSMPLVIECCEHLIHLKGIEFFTKEAPGVILACELLDLESRGLFETDATLFMEEVIAKSEPPYVEEWVAAHPPNAEDWLAPLNFNYR